MKLIGVFGFEEGIALKAECLNKSVQIKINKSKGKLLTPSLPKDFSEKSNEYRKSLIQPKSIISFNEHLNWGQPYTWPSGDSKIITFMLEVEIDEKTFDDKQKELLIMIIRYFASRVEFPQLSVGQRVFPQNIFC